MTEVVSYLGLGSNVGDRLAYLQSAVERLARSQSIEVVKLSPVYQTEPVGYVAQEDFYNMVIEIRTSLAAGELLSEVKRIESELGRIESNHKGPRTIDIDILLYGDVPIVQHKLTVPHSLMIEREFVLRPLYDIAPQATIPTLNITIEEALARIDSHKRVIKLKESVSL